MSGGQSPCVPDLSGKPRSPVGPRDPAALPWTAPCEPPGVRPLSTPFLPLGGPTPARLRVIFPARLLLLWPKSLSLSTAPVSGFPLGRSWEPQAGPGTFSSRGPCFFPRVHGQRGGTQECRCEWVTEAGTKTGRVTSMMTFPGNIAM